MTKKLNQKSPKVYLIGGTKIHVGQLKQYLEDTGNEAFLELLTGKDEIDICSFYAKLCYQSLSLGKNENINRIRDVNGNFRNIIETGHHSVTEHAQLNFIFEGVSRVFHSEMIRHRVGTAYSCESGRYVITPEDHIWIPDYIKNRGEEYVNDFLTKASECNRLYREFQEKLLKGCKNFTEKKKATSAARRLKILGIGETMGVSLNLRSIRHIIVLRTSRHAEEEIRNVFNQVAEIIEKKIPLLLWDMKKEKVDGYYEYTIGSTTDD